MGGASDPFRITDELEDVLLDTLVSRLEVRGRHSFFQKVLREYLDAMVSTRRKLCSNYYTYISRRPERSST
jgi:hypothetical protein